MLGIEVKKVYLLHRNMWNKNTRSATAISAHGKISGQKCDNTISSLSINRSMHDFFHNRTVIIPQPISITHIHISLVSVWEVNFVLFNSMLKYVINRLMHDFFSFQDYYHPSTDIDPLADIGLS